MDGKTKDQIFKVWTGMHRALFSATKGRLGGKAMGMPVVLLETTGRRSGQTRQTMLTSPVQQDDSIVLVASYGGDDRHPAWFLNLRDNPDVTATWSGHTKKMRARIATPEEKQTLWPKATKQYKGYASYQTKTERDIPLVILDPR